MDGRPIDLAGDERAAAPTEVSSNEVPSKILKVGILSEVDRLDPRQPQEFVSSSILYQVFEPPYSQPLQDTPTEPLLFAAPLARDDETRYSATVRDDVVFSDGTPLTAADVVRSIEASGALAGQARSRAEGERVVFELTRPNARFHLTLTQAACGVFRESGRRLLGTGPFAIADDSSPREVRLVRNPRYRSPVRLEEVRFRTYDGVEDLADDLDRGEIHLSYVLSRDDTSRLKRVRKHIRPGSSTSFLYMNTERPALAQVDVRRAIALAIDRTELAKISYTTAFAFTARSPLPPVMGTGRDGIPHDPAKAAELLAGTGVERPRKLRMLTVWGPRPYLPQPREVAEKIVATLAALGIEVEVVPTRDPEDYFAHVGRGDYDLFLSGWNADTPDPAEYLETVLSSRAIPRPGRMAAHGNLSRWSHAETDAALDRYRADPSQMNWQEILRILGDEVPLVPLLYGAAIAVHVWAVRNYVPSPFGWAPLAPVELRDTPNTL